MTLFSLVEGAELVLAVAPDARTAAEAWLPRTGSTCVDGVRAARIDVSVEPAAAAPSAHGRPAIEVLDLAGWVTGECVVLRAGDGRVSSVVELPEGRGRVTVPGPTPDREDVRNSFAALTVTAALLLGRRGRCLLHAGAVLDPDGRAWLLVGDSEAGKSTTCANLVRAGWHFLADDQVVVRREGGTLRAEGWPRSFNLDTGFFDGRPTGLRAPVTPSDLRPDAWRRSAPIAGVLLPRVRPDRPTAVERSTQAGALDALIRQSPWLLADRDAAPAVLALLKDLAELPVHRLRLGVDTFDAPERLATVVWTAVEQGDLEPVEET